MALRRLNNILSHISNFPRFPRISRNSSRQVSIPKIEGRKTFSILAKYCSIETGLPLVKSKIPQFSGTIFQRAFSPRAFSQRAFSPRAFTSGNIHVIDIVKSTIKEGPLRIQNLLDLKDWVTRIEPSLYIASCTGDADLSKLIRSKEIYDILDDIDIIIHVNPDNINIHRINDLCWCILDTALFYSDGELIQKTSNILAKMYNIISFSKKGFYISRTNDMIRYVSFGTEQITVRYCGATLAISLINSLNCNGNFLQIAAFRIHDNLIIKWIEVLTDKEYYEIVTSKGKSLDRAYQELKFKYENLRNAILEKEKKRI